MTKKSPTKKIAKAGSKTARNSNLLLRVSNMRAMVLIGLILMLAGAGILGYQLISLWLSQRTAAAPQPISNVLNGPAVNGEPYVSGVPVHITLTSVVIDLDVIRGYHNTQNNTWTLTLDKAQWGVMTAPANDKSGATFIYGHYRRSVFSRLPKIQTGAIAKVKTDNGHTFIYKFRASSVVPPTDTSVFEYKGKPILIVQTCTGVHFENRQLFVFDLIKVE
ncbi:MAG TPA: sortase [Candidatus Saccharimonadales bacterium]|nr:sortase [Candidatus Saccharimonadales bacterium]